MEGPSSEILSIRRNMAALIVIGTMVGVAFLGGEALAELNPNAKLAVHVLPHTSRSCTKGFPVIGACEDIVYIESSPNVDAFPLFFDLAEYQSFDYGLVCVVALPAAGGPTVGDCHAGSDVVRPDDRHCGGIGGSLVDAPCITFPRTWTVCSDGSGDFTTIQAAINAASGGDIIELCDDTFTGPGNRDVDYLGKAITVKSASGNPEACIVDCQASGGGFIFQSGENSTSRLEGITITNSNTSAILCLNSSPAIVNCILRNNVAGGGQGGAVYCFQTIIGPTFVNCAFLSNSAPGGSGGAVYGISNSVPQFTGCVFSGNSAGSGGAVSVSFGGIDCTDCTFHNNPAGGDGGAVSLWQAGGDFINCTFSGNSAGGYGGGICLNAVEQYLTMERTIIAYSADGEGVWCSGDAYEVQITVTCCDIYGNAGGDWVGCLAELNNTLGNFSACPAFCDAVTGDLRLCDQSPCLPGNHPYGYDCQTIGAWGEGCSCGPTRIEATTWGAIKAMHK